MTLTQALQQSFMNALAAWMGKLGNAARLEVYIEQMIESFIAAQEAAAAQAPAV